MHFLIKVAKNVERGKIYNMVFRAQHRLCKTKKNRAVEKENYCGKLWRGIGKCVKKRMIRCAKYNFSRVTQAVFNTPEK